MFKYYEEGKERTLTLNKVYRMFTVTVDEEQKDQGTTFKSWLSEMLHMQILIRIA